MNFKKKTFKVKVPNTNFYLESNKTYRIIGKVDPSAPIGFQERGITKLEHPMNGEDALVRFDSRRNLWDTGLYEGSPCYSTIQDQKQITDTVKVLKENLIPFLKESLPEGALSQKSDNKHWDSYMFPLNQNLTIATNTPESFFGLWTALLTGAIAPEADKNAPRYRELTTPYVLVDRQEKASNEQKLAFTKAIATKNFVNLLLSDNKKDKAHLVDVLNYVDFRAVLDTEDSILNSQFNHWIDNKKSGLKNAEYFNTAFDRFSTEDGKEELEVYKLLKKAVKNNKVVYDRGEYFLGEDSLGNNLKEAGKIINDNDNLKSKLLEVI